MFTRCTLGNHHRLPLSALLLLVGIAASLKGIQASDMSSSPVFACVDEWSLARPSPSICNDAELLKITDLEVRCEIGFNPHEVGKLQKVLLSATFKPPQITSHDDVAQTVDLRGVGKDFAAFEGRQFNLIETMAYQAAYIACVVHGCRDVTISVKKPGSLRFSQGTEVQVGPYNVDDFPKYNALLSIGSNIDPYINIPKSIQLLRSSSIGTVKGKSRWYQSKPVGTQTEGDPDFINAAIHIETRLLPTFLTRSLRSIESKLGRVRDPMNKNAPRQIDLDVCYLGKDKDTTILVDHDSILTSPHVAMPLADIYPEWRLAHTNSNNMKTLREIVSSFHENKVSLPNVIPDPENCLWDGENSPSV